MIKNKSIGIFLLFLLIHIVAAAQQNISKYNVLFTTPSQNEAGNVPIGNGSLGSNVWVEENGDLLFYLSRNDAHSELQRLLKLGRIRISISGNPFSTGVAYRQVLDVKNGVLNIDAGKPGEKISLQIFVHANSPVMYVKGHSEKPVTVNITLENWRKTKHELNDEELASTWVYRTGVPKGADRWESPDTFLKRKDAIVWYHRNAYSCVPVHIKEQSMDQYASLINDPLKNNTFGGYIRAKGFKSLSDTILQTSKATNEIDVRIAGYARKTPDAMTWEKEITKVVNDAPAPLIASGQTSKWWNQFWNRSWIEITGDKNEELSNYTQTYILSKYQLACQMRNDFPARFQGGIFNVDPKYAYYATDVRKKNYSADYRFYGVNYWWQNVRFLYLPQFAQGNFDMMKPFFDFYFNQRNTFESRAKKYYNASGIYMQECITTFGLPGMGDFGLGAKQYSESYTKDIWQQGLEMAVMMLDYYHYTGDQKFLQEKALPWTRKALEFYNTRFKKDDKGKLRIFPTHGLETYWVEVVNDMPSVAGLHYVLQELIKLPAGLTTSVDKKNWITMQSILPDLPKKLDKSGNLIVDNAESYKPERSNYEAPDLYCLFPFRLYGLNKPNIKEVEAAYFNMPNPGRVCWYQTGIFSARLGLADEAAKDIKARSTAYLKGFRFKGYMDSPHDWKPDYDGVGNMMNTLQEMLVQCDGDKIYLFPAWPREWDVNFKVHAFKNTIIEGVYKKGKLEQLKIFPESRRKDIEVLLLQSHN
ncbi:DUF5703 domain-containing protein [Pedobacter frigoris]|uniref:DUF5703 domain-containing protein n=1 Tax=Pedobacter frigoris TaxID=2571272 RepID=UPI00292D64B1|nr:DUF5703 domain-containing protein [Pedobacter frigoris]